MPNIYITMKDGTKREFLYRGRPGGSYTNKLKFEGAFVIIEDEYRKQVCIPAADIKEIETTPERY